MNSQYEILSTSDDSNVYLNDSVENDDNLENDTERIEDDSQSIVEIDESIKEPRVSTIKYEALIPISRPPTKGRDVSYFWIFTLHLGFLASIGIFSQDNFFHDTILLYKKEGGFAYSLVVATLIGSILGIALSIGISTTSLADILLSLATPLSIVLQIILANIFLAIKTKYWYFGVVVLISAISDSIFFKVTQENLKVSKTLLEMAIKILQKYGYSYSIAVLFTVFMQTCLVLWWGIVFNNVITHVSPNIAIVLVMVLIFSLYWTVQLFHSIMATVSGGCILWYFLKEESDSLNPENRVFLYMQVALTSSIGSICKGALLAPFSQSILSTINTYKYYSNIYVGSSSCRALFNKTFSNFSNVYNFARYHHRLSFSYIATFGFTFNRAACALIENSENLGIVLDDSTSFLLKTLATGISCSFALLISLTTMKEEGSLWPLFLILCFLLIHSGISLVLHSLRSAVDGLIVAYSLKPIKFAEENSILFHRFLRRTETALVEDASGNL